MNNQIAPLSLRPRDAAQMLSVSPRTLYNWTRAGLIPYVKIGRTVLYRVADLEDWLSRQSRRAPGEEGGAK